MPACMHALDLGGSVECAVVAMQQANDDDDDADECQHGRRGVRMVMRVMKVRTILRDQVDSEGETVKV